MTDKLDREAIRARLRQECVRNEGRECQTRRCFIEAGWDGKTTPIPVEAACTEWRAADALDAKDAVIERLVEALEPLASKDVPEGARYNAGAYSLLFKEIEEARAAIRAAQEEGEGHG